METIGNEYKGGGKWRGVINGRGITVLYTIPNNFKV